MRKSINKKLIKGIIIRYYADLRHKYFNYKINCSIPSLWDLYIKCYPSSNYIPDIYLNFKKFRNLLLLSKKIH